jgi:hypothetical protein
MANLLYANNAAGTLSAGITAGSTSLTLNAGQGAIFPLSPQFYVTLTDAATQTLIEIVLVTAVAGDIFSITRGQDGTSALSWNAGDIVSQRTTAAELRGFENAAEGLFQLVQIQPSSTLGIKGTTTNDNANAGSIGEFRQTTTAGVPIASSVVTNANSISLTAGDWDVQGTALFNITGGSFSASQWSIGISPTSGVFAGVGTYASVNLVGNTGAGSAIVSPTVRVTLTTTTTYFQVASVTFPVGETVTVSTLLRARRVR